MADVVKHAPGPWTAHKAPHGPIDIFDANGHDILTLFGGISDPARQKATASVIAAAPDLLACVEMALESSGYEHERKIFRAAIAKATGAA